MLDKALQVSHSSSPAMALKLATPSSLTGGDGEYSENTMPAGPLQEARDPMK